MRIAHRAVTHPWNRMLMLALSGSLVAICLAVAELGLTVPPLAAQTAREVGPTPKAPEAGVVPAGQGDVSAKNVALDSVLLPAIQPFPTPNVVRLVPKPMAQPVEMRSYQGKSYRYVKTLTLRVTAYAPDPRCTFPFPGTTTSSGLPVTTNGGRLVAADTSVIPMYWVVSVPGYAGAAAVPVLDRGNAIKGNRLDVMLPTFEKAQSWGVRLLQVRVYQPVE